MTRCSHEQSDQTIGYNFYHIACRTNGKMQDEHIESVHEKVKYPFYQKEY